MSDHSKSKAELIQELTALRQEVARLNAQVKESEPAAGRIDGGGILTQASDLLQPLLDNLPDWIFIKDAESRIIRSNKAHAQVLGLEDPQEAVGKTDFDFFPPENAERFYQEEQNFLQAGQPIIGRVGPTPAPDGEILWRSETKVPLKDEAGQIIGLIGLSRDVTDLKRTEMALRENEERYRRLFEDSPISLWEEDLSAIKTYTDQLRREGVVDFRTYFDRQPEVVLEYANRAEIIDVNPTTVKMYRATDKEGFFKGLDRIFGLESLETFKEEMIAVAAGKTRFEGESVHYALDGSKINIVLSWSVVPGCEDSYAKVAVSIIDITTQKRAQAALTTQATELQTVAEVSTAAATILETGRLLQEVADLTKDRFGLYHAHIYLLDERGQTLELAAGAGDVGRQMVAEGWGIPVGRERSLVARAVRSRQGVIANDVQAEPDFMANPLLPDTRSEMAVPLMVGERILGVLDVQSDRVNRFTDDDVRIKTALAAQVAVALENASQHEQARMALTEVQESQELLRTIIDATPDWIFIKDREHRYRLVNQGYATSMSLTPEDMVGKNDLEIGFPEEIVKGDPEQGIRGFWADDTEVMDRGEIKIIEVEPGVVGGKPVFLNTVKVPLRDTTGDVWGVLGFVHDITELKQAEEALRESQAQLSEALEIARLGYWEFDAESQAFAFNDQFYRLLHTTAETEGGYSMAAPDFARKYLHPDDAPRVAANIQNALETSDPNFSHQEVSRLIRADGEICYTLVRFRILKNETGQTIKLIGANQDVTEQRQAEEALRESQERSQTILESVTVPLLISGIADGKILYANQPLAETLLTSLDTLIGQQTPNFYVDLADRKKVVGQIQEQGHVTDYELQLSRSNGELFWALLTARLMNFQGQPAIITTLIDITERKNAQELLARRAAELEAVAQVSTAAATILQPGRLLQEVADLTKERFGLYHAHIYLLDPAGDRLHLAAGAGEIGQQMVAEGWSISLLRAKSLVAQAARERQGTIVNDVQADPSFLPNPLLPETRSEMAVPMIVGDQLLGVLDVQANVTGRFTAEDVRVHTTLAAQVAVALQNARSYAQTQARARHEQILRQITSRVRGSTNPDAIARTAIRELGTALDRPTFIRLGKTGQLRLPTTENDALPTPPGPAGGNGPGSDRPEGDA